MLAVEGVKRAQERFGKGKVMTGEQARWGYENLALDQKKLDALGFAGVMRPVSTSCADHMGARWARVHTWDGAKWNFTSDWYRPTSRSSSRWSRRRPTSTRREEADPPHARRLPELIARPGAVMTLASLRQGRLAAWRLLDGALIKRRARRFERVEGHRHVEHPAQRQRHRGHLQPRDPGAQGRVVAGARGQDRRAAGRQRRRQDDHAARGEQPAGRRARRGDQGLDRIARRAHRKAVAPRRWSTAA